MGGGDSFLIAWSMMAAAEFRRRWEEAWQRLGAGGPSCEPLLALYAEPHRAYHNAEHIIACLAELDACSAAVAQRDALTLALFFHDAIYDPRRGDNEEASAVVAGGMLGGRVASALLADVQRLIRITDHRHPPTAEDQKLIVDVDLSILGKPRAVFAAYETAIRAEYAHVPDDAFRAGRAKVLRHFLDRPRIYVTPQFVEQYEHAARVNLEWSLAQLQN